MTNMLPSYDYCGQTHNFELALTSTSSQTGIRGLKMKKSISFQGGLHACSSYNWSFFRKNWLGMAHGKWWFYSECCRGYDEYT